MSITVLKKKHFTSKNISHNNNFSKFPGMSSKTFMNRKKYCQNNCHYRVNQK